MRTTLTAFVVTVALAVGVIAQQKRPQDIDLQAAIRAEMVDGDLRGAIRQYAAIVAKYNADRALTATALLHMAECYQKMGDPQSGVIYERLVRDYSDQTDVMKLARVRLGGSSGSADGKGSWRGPEVDTHGAISPDGRHLSYTDRKTGDLAIRDVIAGTSRRLTAAPGDFSDFAEESAVSRDGRQVAYAWYEKKTGRYALRILPIDATPATTPRATADNPDLEDIIPYDWSPDGRWIAARLSRGDRSAQIGLISTRDLSVKVLKSVDWLGPTKMFFSPDGRYLAYDIPVGDVSRQRDIFVLSIDGSGEVPAVAHSSNDVVMGWASDGRSLLFASNRVSGAMGLWAVSMAEASQPRPLHCFEVISGQ